MSEEFHTAEQKCEQAEPAKNCNPKPKGDGCLVPVDAVSASPSEYAGLDGVANCNQETSSYGHGANGFSNREAVPIQEAHGENPDGGNDGKPECLAPG